MLAPVLNGAALELPPVLYFSFWRYVAFLLVGYLIVISILVLIKRLILRR